MNYKHFQFGWVIVISFIIAICIIAFTYIYQMNNFESIMSSFIIIGVIFAAGIALFYGMTIIVTDKHIVFKFGIGLISKKIDISRITAIETGLFNSK